MDEQLAIMQLKQGNVLALEPLVRSYQTQALRVAWLITCDWSVAEDIVQASFINVVRNIAKFDGARPFGPWFLKCVANDALKAVSRQQTNESLDRDTAGVEPHSELPDLGLGPAELFEQAETAEEIRAALRQLSPRLRASVVLRYYLGLSEGELAERLGCPPGTAKRRLHDARKRLHRILRPLLWERAAITPIALTEVPDLPNIPNLANGPYWQAERNPEP